MTPLTSRYVYPLKFKIMQITEGALAYKGLRCDYAPEEGGAELLASTSDEPAAVRDSEHCQPMY